MNQSPKYTLLRRVSPSRTTVIAALLVPACSTTGTRQSTLVPSSAERTASESTSPRAVASDAAIQRAIVRRLESSGALPVGVIRVNVAEGVAKLEGEVNRGDERMRAAELAERTRGVRAVVNLLTVKPTGASDPDLSRRISNSLKAEAPEDLASVVVRVEGSRVDLSGVVPRALAKEMAERLAWYTAGVTAVENRIRVVPGYTRTDQEVAEALRASLRNDPYLGSANLTVVVKDGTAELTGEVGSAFQKRRARRRALVAGVIDVSDVAVRVVPRPAAALGVASPVKPPSESQTVAAIRDALSADPRLPESAIQVDANYGVVTLTGVVPTLAQKLWAAEDARSAIGVWAVVNRLVVSPALAAAGLTDLDERVSHKLRQSPLVSADRIQVSVTEGRVVLAGEAASYFERNAAERAAATVPGVTAVENRLKVEPSQKHLRSDQELKQEVEGNLWWDQRVGDTQVRVSVKNGVVTVSGQVPNAEVYDAVLQNVYEAAPLGVVDELRRPEPPRFVYP